MYPCFYQCLLALHIWLLVIESYEYKTFESTRFPNGKVACATGNPTKAFRLNQNQPCGECSDSCKVYGMQCAWHCSQDDGCTNYNYKEDTRMCEIFNYPPRYVSFVTGCYHFQV